MTGDEPVGGATTQVRAGPTATDLQVLESEGYLVLHDVMTDQECDQLSELADYACAHNEDCPHPYDPEPGVGFTPNLLRHSAAFQRCVTDPMILGAVRSMLGQDIRLRLVNGRRSDPGHGGQPLHELARRRGRPFYGCNTIWCLDPFTESNGATRVLPRTHLDDTAALAALDDPAGPHRDEITVVAPRGSVLLFNAQLIHAGGTNNSDNPRRVVQSYYTVPSIPTHYDWTALPPAIVSALTPAALRLLGLESW